MITALAHWSQAGPPLDPDPDEAQRLLREELAKPDYHDTNVVQQIFDWIQRRIEGSLGSAQQAPALSSAVAIVVALLLLTTLILVVSRARRTARATSTHLPALTEEPLTAEELRARAEAWLAREDPSAALVDAFRALAVRQVEMQRIEDIPQATAREIARALAVRFADHVDAVHHAADVFDLTLYGEQSASVAQAQQMLRLDDELAGRRSHR
ncbi:MAG: DUF4129 domain-containing protein [Nocardioidaceae bacterium]|nr:DUF4129 domain-containing protein [Nocardioidaceae bacterium]